MEAYLGKLDHAQRNSFAPIKRLISESMDGLDLHLLVLKDTQDIAQDNDAHIRGLVIFNQESLSAKLPNGRAAVKVLLHHVTTIDPHNRETILDMAMDYIWKFMHCAAVRMNLYHFKTPGVDQFKADPEMKKMLKAKKFKWKTVINDTEADCRYEILEVLNVDFLDQRRQSKATIYREGLQKDDILKEPLNIFFSSMIAFGNQRKENKME